MKVYKILKSDNYPNCTGCILFKIGMRSNHYAAPILLPKSRKKTACNGYDAHCTILETDTVEEIDSSKLNSKQTITRLMKYVLLYGGE